MATLYDLPGWKARKIGWDLYELTVSMACVRAGLTEPKKGYERYLSRQIREFRQRLTEMVGHDLSESFYEDCRKRARQDVYDEQKDRVST